MVGADQRGLGALAVLIAGEPDQRRCEYAHGIADLVAEEADAVADEWAEYGPALVTDDTTANDAIRDIVSNASLRVAGGGDGSGPSTIERGLIDGARLAMLGDDRRRRAVTAAQRRRSSLVCPTSSTAGDAAAAELSLSVDVVSELGITLNFSDADGDG